MSDKALKPRQSLHGLFDMAKKIQKQKEEHGENTEVIDVIKDKLDKLQQTGDMESDTIPPLVIGTTGIVLQGNKLTKQGYLDGLKVDESLYSDLILTREEALKINDKMTRFTSGVNSVVPMVCTGERCAFKSTCVTGDTLIHLIDGTRKPIRDIKKRDRIYSFNTETRRLEIDYAKKDVVSKGVKPVYKIVTELGYVLRATKDHPIYSSEDNKYEWMYACIETGLRPGDAVLVTDMHPTEKMDADIDGIEQDGDMFVDIIASIEQDGEEEVYDFEVLINKNYIGGSLLQHNCPFYEAKKAPVGLPCLVEANLLHFYTSQYMEEFDVDASRITEMHLIGELAEFDIYEMRATKLIAEKYPTMMQDYCMGFDSDGNAIINEDISKVFDLKERLKKSRMKILETLMATRKERAKAVVAAINTEQVGMSSLRNKLDIILKQVKENGAGGKPITIDHEDIVDADTK